MPLPSNPEVFLPRTHGTQFRKYTRSVAHPVHPVLQKYPLYSQQVSESCYYIQSPAKIGLIKLGGNDVCLIDSGNDKETGRKVRQILDANGWRLKAIYNTHSNADHIGGNKYLQTQTGCDIFAAGIERDFTEHPILEPSFLYGGFPPECLRHKFLLAQDSEVDVLTQDALPEGIRMIPLPGHFFDMVGYKSAFANICLVIIDK